MKSGWRRYRCVLPPFPLLHNLALFPSLSSTASFGTTSTLTMRKRRRYYYLRPPQTSFGAASMPTIRERRRYCWSAVGTTCGLHNLIQCCLDANDEGEEALLLVSTTCSSDNMEVSLRGW